MLASFDIFKVENAGALKWIEAATQLEAAKERVQNLMKIRPGEYLIYSQRDGQKFSMKPASLNDTEPQTIMLPRFAD
jgi:hypothetical protein